MDLPSVMTERLLLIFPEADPGYLAECIQFSIKDEPVATPPVSRKGKAKANVPDPQRPCRIASLVGRISQKLLDLNHSEYPRAEWRQLQLTQRENREKRVVEMAEVRRTWSKATGASGNGSGGGSPPPAADLIRMVDETMSKNQALIRLHVMFPTLPIGRLRDTISALPHSYLFSATDQILRETQPKPQPKPSSWWFPDSRTPSASRPSIPGSNVPVLTPRDLFRSPEYIEALAAHLKSIYPMVATSTIRSLVVDGGSYGDVREAVRTWRSKQHPIKIWFGDRFLSRGSSASSSSSTFDSLEAFDGCPELVAEILEYERPARATQEEEDVRLARELNLAWTDPNQLLQCGCCFDEVTFEDLAACSNGEHVFCRVCVGRQVEEHVYGGAPLSLYSGGERVGPAEGTGVRCLSTEGCQAPFSHRELQRVLSPGVFAALSRRLGEAALQSALTSSSKGQQGIGGETLVRCPFCPYTEVQDAAVLSRAFPFLSQINTPAIELPYWILTSLFAAANFTFLYVFLGLAIFLAPEPFVALAESDGKASDNPVPLGAAASTSTPTTLSDSHRPLFPLLEPCRVLLLAHGLIVSLARKVLLSRTGGRPIFQCRNGPNGLPLAPFGSTAPGAMGYAELVERVWGKGEDEGTCGRSSCLTCSRPYVEGMHRCFEDEREGMRLAVEKAMSDAVKRNCPACGVSFLKESGCNKIVCRCGYTMCFVCRKEIGVEKYNHFCSHFRPVGIPCQTCTKCSLWVAPDEKEAIAKAANQARQAWLQDHPAVGGGGRGGLHQVIGPASVSEHLLERVTRVCEVVLEGVLY